jgi:hypothetical protein
MPTFRYKRLVEQQLQESESYTIFAFALMMTATLFSSRMLRDLSGNFAAFLVLWSYLKLIGNMIDRHGLALIGNGKTHAFVTKMAADFMNRAIHHPQAETRSSTWEAEILSFDEAIEVSGERWTANRPLHAPAALFSALQGAHAFHHAAIEWDERYVASFKRCTNG